MKTDEDYEAEAEDAPVKLAEARVSQMAIDALHNLIMQGRSIDDARDRCGVALRRMVQASCPIPKQAAYTPPPFQAVVSLGELTSTPTINLGSVSIVDVAIKRNKGKPIIVLNGHHPDAATVIGPNGNQMVLSPIEGGTLGYSFPARPGSYVIFGGEPGAEKRRQPLEITL